MAEGSFFFPIFLFAIRRTGVAPRRNEAVETACGSALKNCHQERGQYQIAPQRGKNDALPS
jgi:hypothetical protein